MSEAENHTNFHGISLLIFISTYSHQYFLHPMTQLADWCILMQEDCLNMLNIKIYFKWIEEHIGKHVFKWHFTQDFKQVFPWTQSFITS